MTTTEISCAALAHLGMNPITDMNGLDPGSKACLRYFAATRNDLLREHDWSFAKVREALVRNLDDDNDVIGWAYTYTYPASAAAVWSVYNEGVVADRYNQDFEVIYNPTLDTKVILSDLEVAYVEYSYKVENPARWDDKFVEAFTYRLAAKMSHILIGDPSIGLKLMELSNAILSEAKRIGFNEKMKKPYQSSGYIDSR